MDGVTDLRTLERDSIRAFVQRAADEGYLSGRVLDYGCGKQPYRNIVEAAGGEYVGFDRAHYPANVSGEDVGPPLTFGVAYDAVLCTQVVQFASDPSELLANIGFYTVDNGGHLVMTYATTWEEKEAGDLWRFTMQGMEHLLVGAGFTIERHEARAKFSYGGLDLALGGGVVARA